MGPLSFLRRLIPASAGRDETALYDRLYKEVGARRDALEGKIQKATMRAGSDSDAQRALVASPKYQELERQLNPLFIARGNLLSAKFAAPNDDLTARLLLGINDAETRHLASLLHRGTRYHAGDRFLPENGVYIEGLSSEVPGAGTQLLKDLEAQFPGAPMYLESVATPATKEFYLKKGFMPQPEGSTPAIPSNLWIKPGDVKVRAKGGLVRMQQGGQPPEETVSSEQQKAWSDALIRQAQEEQARRAAEQRSTPLPRSSPKPLPATKTHPRHQTQGGLSQHKGAR